MAQVVLVTIFTWLTTVMPSSAGSQPACTPPADGISAWFPGEDTRDVFGNAAGVLIGEAQIVPGFRGNAFEFDGLNDSVSVPGTAGLDLQEFTVEAWIQRRATDRVGNDGPAVLMSGNAGAWVFAMNPDGSLYLGKIGIQNSTPRGAIQDLNWHHVGVTRRGSLVQFYVDGVMVGDATYAETFLPSETYGIGGLSKPYDKIVYSFMGRIDEMTVYRSVLGAEEFAALANRESQPRCRDDLELTLTSSPVRLAQGGDYSLRMEVRNRSAHLARGVQMTVDIPGAVAFLGAQSSQGATTNSAVAVVTEFGDLPAGAMASLTLQWRASGNATGWITQNVTLSPNPVDLIPSNNQIGVRFLITGGCVSLVSSFDAMWRAEESTAELISGVQGTDLSNIGYTPGIVGTAFSFRENHSMFRVPLTTPLPAAEFTIDAWIRRASTQLVSPTGNHSFIVGGPVGSLGFGVVPDGRIYVSNLPNESIFSTGTISDTEWHHVAVTRAGSDMRFYIDGVSSGSSTYAGVFNAGTFLSIGGLIGWDVSNSYSFLGDVDELEMHSRALTADEVSEIAFAGSSGRCFQDLRLLIKSSPAEVVLNDTFEVAFRVDQIGTQASDEARFLTVLPLGIDFVDGTSELGAVTESAGVVKCDFGRVLPGAGGEIRLRLRARTTRDYRFDAQVLGTAQEASESNNLVQLRIIVAEFQMALDPVTMVEGSLGTSNRMEFNFRFSPARDVPLVLNFASEDLTAMGGVDYLAVSGETTVPAGSTNARVEITVVGDARFERAEEFRLRFAIVGSVPQRSIEVTATIQNDDPAPIIQVLPATWNEGSSGLREETFGVRVIGETDLPLRFHYSIGSLVARADSDFVTGEGDVVLAPGVTQGRIPVLLHGDSSAEPDELLQVQFSNPIDCQVPPDRVRGLILNDDASGFTPATFRVELPSESPEPGRPFPVVVTALDGDGRELPGFNGAARLTARRGSGIPSRVVISEVVADSQDFNDYVELLNAGTNSVSLRGWRITLFSPLTWPEPAVVLTVNRPIVLGPGELIEVRQFLSPGNATFTAVNPAGAYPWNGFLATGLFGDPLVGVVVEDDGGQVEDVFLAGNVEKELLELSLGAEALRWEGDPVAVSVTNGFQFQRRGNQNTRSARDWTITATSTPRVPGPELRLPLLDALPIRIFPELIDGFTNGIWRGMVTLPDPFVGTMLAVDDGNGHIGRSLPMDSRSDLDSDGLPDAWEIENGLSYLDPKDSAEDPDRDGLTSFGEWTAGTNPRDPASVLRLRISPDQLEWAAVAGRRYRLEQRTTLPGSPWELRTLRTADTSTVFSESLGTELDGRERWFRLVVELP